MSINTMPSSFWYFLMMSPVITYFIKLSSIRSKGRYFSLFTIITGKIFADFRIFLSQNEYFYGFCVGFLRISAVFFRRINGYGLIF